MRTRTSQGHGTDCIRLGLTRVPPWGPQCEPGPRKATAQGEAILITQVLGAAMQARTSKGHDTARKQRFQPQRAEGDTSHTQPGGCKAGPDLERPQHRQVLRWSATLGPLSGTHGVPGPRKATAREKHHHPGDAQHTRISRRSSPRRGQNNRRCNWAIPCECPSPH